MKQTWMTLAAFTLALVACTPPAVVVSMPPAMIAAQQQRKQKSSKAPKSNINQTIQASVLPQLIPSVVPSTVMSAVPPLPSAQPKERIAKEHISDIRLKEDHVSRPSQHTSSDRGGYTGRRPEPLPIQLEHQPESKPVLPQPVPTSSSASTAKSCQVTPVKDGAGNLTTQVQCQSGEPLPQINLKGDSLTQITPVNNPAPAMILPDAPYPGFNRGERLAYVSIVNGQEDVFLTTLDGRSVSRVTQTPDQEHLPVFAPDARLLVFATDRLKRGWELFASLPTGERVIRLTADYLDVESYDWSVKNELLFLNHNELYVYTKADRTIRHLLPGLKVASPTWSPDGETIAFADQGSLVTIDRLGQHFQIGVPQANITGKLDWAPNDQAFVYESNGKLYRVTWGGTPALLSDQQDSEPVWSPDSQKIAFTSKRTGRREIFVMNADKSNVSQLTFNQGESYQPAW